MTVTPREVRGFLEGRCRVLLLIHVVVLVVQIIVIVISIFRGKVVGYVLSNVRGKGDDANEQTILRRR